MKSGHHAHGKHNGSLHIVSHYSFLGPKWPPEKRELVYRFRSSAAANVDPPTMQSACIRALSSWAAVSSFRFRAPIDFREITDILMGFHRLNHFDGSPFDGPLGVLGHASGPEGGEAHLDADEKWRLGHSSDTNAVMFSGIGGGQRKRTPTADDVNGIRALYG
ncbi:hypothetical protein MKW94_007270 [Papaver nudicaule]|uniref:Peptidase metallopeptidase domain-containing protein n=1 Tax=Papaver nudicaule TaxID=74823 RepID=A0AA42B339_PAPNU|nr:hypothetical protein [Papaver nudicaule]